MVLSASNLPALIPGYECISRLGAGGFGEVWRVAAPGGLDKAIKLVYGQVDEERAARELKALERIKGVRHPFLLSLERIEIIDARLMIVTELAEGSIVDRAKECRAEGLPGIPRVELIGYMADAADALDYMYRQHSLQHLDIKPENLLLVGGHTKVADFGLVKEVVERTVSLVGGLTPIYASPETFSGTPSRQSDQYSLAVVYQELLTGKPPFVGSTPAQLAMMHTQGCPHLTPLPAEDRAIVGRALAKKPEARYASCSEFVNALRGLADRPVGQSKGPAAAVGGDGSGLASETDKASLQPQTTGPYKADSRPLASNTEILRTEVLDNPAGTNDSARRPSVAPRPVIEVSRTAERLPPPTPDQSAHGMRPTLFIGVGGLGTELVRRLRRRIDQRQPEDAVPKVQFLALDTDPTAIDDAGRHPSGACLPPEDRLCLPLRTTQEYKARSDDLLEWLSRRWLYNIPRSMRTQGFRPLGRLALVDHRHAVIETVRRKLQTFASTDDDQCPNGSTGQAEDNRAPQVFIVGAISGGTGGGMLLDVGAATRCLLREIGADGATLDGVMLHVVDHQPTQAALATANTYATLCELYHLTRLGSGDQSEESPTEDALRGARNPFDVRQLVNLGGETGDDEIAERLRQVEDYLVCRALTALCAVSLAHEPPPDPTVNPLDVELRSFAIHRQQAPRSDTAENVANQVAAEVFRRWIAEEGADAVTASRQRPPKCSGSAEIRASQEPRSATSVHDDDDVPLEWIDEHAAHYFKKLVRSNFARRSCRLLTDWGNALAPGDRSRRGDMEQQATIMLSYAAGQLAEISQLVETADSTGDDPTFQAPESVHDVELVGRLASSTADSAWTEFADSFSPRAQNSAHSSDRRQRASLIDRVRAIAHELAARENKEWSTGNSAYVQDHGGCDEPSLSRAIDEMALPLANCGHQFRDFIVVPRPPNETNDSQASALPQGVEASIVPGLAGEAGLIVREARGISLAHVAQQLIGSRQDLCDAARRLHARNDVDWIYPPEVRIEDEG